MRKFRFAAVLLAVILLVSAVSISAFAEEEPAAITFQLRVDRNTFWARYGVTFMFDDMVLAHLNQGDRATVITLAKGYEHTLTMVPDKEKAETKTWVLNGITDGTLVVCRIQTHLRYLELREEGINIGGGPTYHRLDDNLKLELEAYGVSVKFEAPTN